MLSPEAMAPSKVEKTVSFSFRTTPETLKLLDELRRKEADLPSRAKMLTRLVKRAAEAAEKAKN
jgi:hypothetical protein